MDGTTPEEYLGFQKMSPRPKSRWRQPTVLSLLGGQNGFQPVGSERSFHE